MSLLYEEKMDYVKAIEMFEEIRKIEPKNVEVLFNIGMLHEKKGESEKALTIMDNVLKIDPDYPNALNFVGYLWAEKGIRLDEAEIMIKKALLKNRMMAPSSTVLDGYIIRKAIISSRLQNC